MFGLKNSSIVIVSCLVVGLSFPAGQFASAETMSSTNYAIQDDVMSLGGGNSTSTDYASNDTIGDLATGEDLTSTNYLGCSGFECFHGAPFLTFAVTAGTDAPGTAGTPVHLGKFIPTAVTTSNGSSINSIFIALETNASGGAVVSVTDDNNGLKSPSILSTIPSATATLVPGTPGYGICVFSATQGGDSPTTFDKLSPYDGSCTKTTGHDVGLVATSPNNVLSSSGELAAGSAEILVKTAVSWTSPAAPDYSDNLTFVATGTY
jgi:hypothetical protein